MSAIVNCCYRITRIVGYPAIKLIEIYERNIFTEKYTIRFQLLLSFILTSVISIGLTLALLFGLLYGTGSYTITTARNTIISHSKSNAYNVGLEIAGAIEEQIKIVAESISLSNALYSKNLITNAKVLYQASGNDDDGIGNVRRYPEFCFGSTWGNTAVCGTQPPGYGAFAVGDTRLPISLPDFSYGSLTHTSIYMADTTSSGSATNPGRRTDNDWTTSINDNGFITVIDALGFQDQDLKLLYNQGPNSTVFFYVSAQYGSSSSYKAAHRTFPGLVKSNDTYNPPQRGWFKRAPEDAFYVSAYNETFSQQLVITISSRKTISSSDSGLASDTVVVAAATLLLSTVAKMLTDITYQNEGFGVLLSYSNLHVLSWSNKNVYDVYSNSFVSVGSIDPNLALLNLQGGGKFEYTDPSGVSWIVASAPFLEITDYQTQKTNYAFIILVFSKQSLALSTMSDLQNNVDTTLNSSTKNTLIILAIIVFAIMNFVGFTIFYIVTPIDKMRHISAELIRIAGDDEDNRDYTNVINHPFFTKYRADEVGHTAFEYYRVICVLNNRIVQKRKVPKCPKNPFFIKEGIDYSDFNWNKFYSLMTPKNLKVSQILRSSEVVIEEPDMTDSLDVLGQIAAAKNKTNNKNKKNFIKVNLEEDPVVDDNDGDIELGNLNASEDIAVVPQDKFKTSRFASIGLKLYLLCILLLIGLLIVAILTITDLWYQGGQSWMTKTSYDMEIKQMENLKEISYAKSAFVKYFFQKIYVTLESARQFSNYAFAGIISTSASRTTSASNYFDNTYFPLHGKTLNSDDSSFSTPPSSAPTNSFSGYYINTNSPTPTWISSGCPNCDVPSRLSSVLDLKFSSFMYSTSFAAFVQLGLQTEGYFRNLPFTPASYNNPNKCTIEDTTQAVCLSASQNSKCIDSTKTNYNYYDPRCRTWYAQAYSYLASPNTYFGYPRISSAGLFVITATAPIYGSITSFTSSTFKGAININALATTLTNSVNALKILSDGYAYIIDTTAPSYLIMHPKASGSCLQVECAEGFSGSEYQTFDKTVLTPIMTGSTPASSYKKNGKEWRLASTSFQYATIKYTLVATVSLDSILEASNSVKAAIQSAVITLIVVFAFGIFFVTIAALELTNKMIKAIVDPIQDLRYICTKLANNDYSCTIPTDSSSRDMKQLLDAFSHLLVALKFGSDTFARGDVHLAKEVFTDALNLFETTQNGKGMSACHNNLGVVETALKNYAAAEIHYNESISFITKYLRQGNHINDDYERAQKILSDRKGNLALLYLEKEEFKKAFDLLEELLDNDKKNGYIRGCVIKQGNLGQYYLKQGEIKSAERIFNSALKFASNKDSSLYDGNSWNQEEAYASEQIALYNLAKMFITKKSDIKKGNVSDTYNKEKLDGIQRVEAKLSVSNNNNTNNDTNNNDTSNNNNIKNNDKNLENRLLEALTKTPYMHIATTKSILDSLVNIYNEHKDTRKVDEITNFASYYKFDLKTTMISIPKRIAFVIDYSGSMSGTKIKAAVQSMLMIFDNHMNNNDEVMLVKFTHNVSLEFPLTRKGNDEIKLRSIISNMINPSGATAFRDGVNYALQQFHNSGTNDWIISLTDGDDNSSKISDNDLKNEIMKSKTGLVVIGVGSDVDERSLKPLTEVTTTGFYLKAGSNFDSISAAFGKVANIIQGQMVLEDV